MPELPVRPDADEFAELALSLHESATFAETVERVLDFAVKALSCAYAGVILVHDRSQVETVAASHPIVADLDRIQVETGQGPDLEILSDHHGVVVRDVRTEQRWPQWAAAVAAAGVRSMVGTRLHTSSSTIGSLNCYDTEPDRFGPVEADIVHMIARHAAVALDSARGEENLWKAVDARNLIGQAQGILMERFKLDADQAFGVLRRYSQDKNIKLHVVAERLIGTRRLPD